MPSRSQSSGRKIPVLYRDDHYIAFDKPSGLLVIPTPKQEKRTLTAIVNAQYPVESGGRLHPCHRLDKDTSGVILFARGKKAQQLMMTAFKTRQVKKVYIAFAHGRLPRRKGEIRSAVKGFEKKRFSKRSPALEAVTRYQVTAVKEQFSVVNVFPLTGRTNQIRIHFKEIGHPLVGEDKYAFRKDFALRFRRTALHASELSWPDPIREKTITVQSPLPKDMEDLIAKHD